MAFDFPAAPVPGQIFTQANITYTWDGQAWMTSGAGSGGGAAPYVLKAGDIMSGYLTLSGDPTQPLHAATKQYVDALLALLPPPGAPGDALVTNVALAPQWAAPIEGGTF